MSDIGRDKSYSETEDVNVTARKCYGLQDFPDGDILCNVSNVVDK